MTESQPIPAAMSVSDSPPVTVPAAPSPEEAAVLRTSGFARVAEVEVAPPIVAPPLLDRPEQFQANLCIFDLAVARRTRGAPNDLAAVLRYAKARSMEVGMTDDDEKPFKGLSNPESVRVDGLKVYADVVFQVIPDMRIEKLFGIRDADPAAIAAHKEAVDAIQRVSSESVLALSQLLNRTGGATQAEIDELAAAHAMPEAAVRALVSTIREMQAVVAPLTAPGEPQQDAINEAPPAPRHETIAGTATLAGSPTLGG